jgi:hypothetical protein
MSVFVNRQRRPPDARFTEDRVCVLCQSETIRKEPLDFTSVAQSAIGRTWQSARCNPGAFSPAGGLGRLAAVIFCWYEVPFCKIDGE